MVNVTLKLYQLWKNRILVDFPQDPDSITAWLFGQPSANYSALSSHQLTQQMDYRYRILQKRYLKTSAQEGYKQLVRRLSVIIVEYPPIAQKLSQKSNYHGFILSLTQSILAEIVHYDLEAQRTIKWIGQLTSDTRLQEILLLASLEAYCSRLVNDQPVIIHRLREFLQQDQSALSA